MLDFTPEVLAAYVPSIQMGEFFFILAYLLSENLQGMSLTSENHGDDISFVVGPIRKLKFKKNNRKHKICNVQTRN